MGNIFSVSLSGDTIVSGCRDSIIGQQYVRKLQENHEALQTSLQELTAIKNDWKTKVGVAVQQPHMRPSERVQLWISRVETMEAQANQVVREGNQEIQKLCCGGYCSNNYMSSYKYAKKVAKMLVQVDDLKSKGVFEEVAQSLPAPLVNEVPVVPTVGMESTFDKVWRYIEGDQVRIIGLYGTGGVGKTTLLKQINNKFVHTLNDFNLVIWVVVSQNHKLETIQDEIGEKIGLSSDKWKKKEQHGKAQDIFNVLNKKKFVLLLDDIWEPVEIIQVGVPIPDDQNKSKIIFTTRSEDVCGHMNAHKIKVDYLAWNKAWELFQKNVGTETLVNIHTDIAQTVAKECGGLPLALITVGRTMACKKTPEEWNQAIQVLKKFPSKISGMEKNVFHLLKFSFDNLPNKKVQSCFLYCALFPDDFLIHKDALFYCWMCEGILDEYANVDEAKNESYDIIGTLLSACLLEPQDGRLVKMHDVTRDMALWLVCDPKKTNKNFLVHTGSNLIDAPNVEEWKGIERVSLIHNRIENLVEKPESPNLLTLFLQENKLKKIGETFFDSMRSLQVLDLSINWNLTQLPSGVSKLAFLQHLNLSRTGIRELPMELKALVRLKYLNLESTRKLNFVPSHIISSFSMLKVLRMLRCGDDDKCPFDSEKAMLDELQCLKHLEVLTLTIRSTSCFEQLFSYKNLATRTRDLNLQLSDKTRFLDLSSSLANMKHIHFLRIEKCTDLEELKVNWEARGPNDPRESMTINQSCFVGLQIVSVLGCPKMKDLTWLIFAPNLILLVVDGCSEMEKIMSLERLGGVANEVKELNPFAKLKELSLENLPKLQSIYEGALPFPYLKDVCIRDCPELKKLPLDSRSAQGCNLIIRGEEEWWNGLEWDDQDAPNHLIRTWERQAAELVDLTCSCRVAGSHLIV